MCFSKPITMMVFVFVDVDVWSPIGSQLVSTPPTGPIVTARSGTPFRAHRDSV